MSYETYYGRYKELCDTYRIRHGTYGLVPNEELKKMSPFEAQQAINKALEEYDVVVEHSGSGYACSKYKVVRNVPKLGSKDLAIICDSGNLCFGYRTSGNDIVVYTD